MGGFAALAAMVLAAGGAHAQFVTFQGDAGQEAAWRAAVGGTIPLEDFEGFHGSGCCNGPSDLVTALPNLGVVLATDVPGAYPGIYVDIDFAHSGTNQLANFNGGLGAYSNYRILPAPGRTIRALGFWQCDPQGTQRMEAYAADGSVVGEIVGHINDFTGHGFAGFVSDVPIVRVEVPGNLGDGWNHIDDLQVKTDPPVTEDPPCDPDVNLDGNADQDDVTYLINVIGGGPNPSGVDPDITHDGNADQDDVTALINVVAGGNCP